MNHKIIFILLMFFGTLISASMTEAKSRSGFKASAVHSKSYKHGGQVKYQKGYYGPKKGRWTKGHMKASPDNTKVNNKKK